MEIAITTDGVYISVLDSVIDNLIDSLIDIVYQTWYQYYKKATQQQSNVGSVVEFSPATREARVRFPDVAFCFFNVELTY